MSMPAVEVVLSFVEKINQGDLFGIETLLAPQQKSNDLAGDVTSGAMTMILNWRKYLTENPDYTIYIRQVYTAGDRVILIGHTTGSHLELPEVVEFHTEGVIWLTEVSDGKVSTWQLLQDTQENYDTLRLKDFECLFRPAFYAQTIAKHLDLLPPGSRTQDVRNVRKFYSQLYRDAQPEEMLLLAEKLLFEEGYRFVPYELIYYHPGAIEALNPERVLALGRDINDWSSTDIYAHFILGPAWKKGIIKEEHINQWIVSEDLWQRRAAVVSTIYLDGDIDKMLQYTEMLLDDQEDLIIKALSWVLRSAIQYDRNAVINFLDEHQGRLDARIKREVTNKLETGLKTP